MQDKTASLDLNVKGAFQHAASCFKNQELVMHLIQRDAALHHLFFNEEGYHNHLVHQLLADYSLGADKPRLEKSYYDNAVYQRPRRPLRPDFVWNSLDCLGNESYYTNYVKFFEDELHKKGIKACIQHVVFEQDPRLGLFSRFLSGIYHPLIHLGYGIEFNCPLMVAEGLAWVAVHQPRLHHFYECLNSKIKNKTDHASLSTALEIILSIHQDPRIDGIIQWADEDKYTKVIEVIPALLLEYLQLWPVNESLEGSMGLKARATELQILASVVYAGSHRPGKKTMLDFFLMHTLTSSLFLHCYVEFLDPPFAAILLQAKFAADMAYYIAHGRPALNLDQFKNDAALLNWDQILSKAIASEDDHVPKVVRALIHASWYDKAHTLSFETYQAMATLSVKDDLYWSLDAIGFDEAWQSD